MPSQLFVAIVGVGLVGSEVINEIFLLESTIIRIVSISSSSKWIYEDPTSHSSQTITQAAWKERLKTSTVKPDPDELCRRLSALASGETGVVIVDNTSSSDIAALYPQWLRSGFHVVTPNKRAFAGPQSLWDEIKTVSEAKGLFVGKSATVGAGSPVIETAEKLVAAGEQITHIHGVISGTISQIFNTFSPATLSPDSPTFSSTVRVAREHGHTEPNPAEDLAGLDMARKLTILTRICGPYISLPDGVDSVLRKTLVPESLRGITDGDEFLDKLQNFDGEFDEMRKKAAEEGKVIRYVGTVDIQRKLVKTDIETQVFDKTHPLALPTGSYNIVLFYTEARGKNNPLIVEGKGAGPVGTAKAVIGDLLKTLNPIPIINRSPQKAVVI
ncbi:homoserine dehydrogenase-domain-containing protein [Flagelloscypha sp. PMI_526]|nr:homoserine dehydrogenase-domain-containing protein [Flagelloscypha sp. PMI_526]